VFIQHVYSSIDFPFLSPVRGFCLGVSSEYL
jgi:hypothetical protein